MANSNLTEEGNYTTLCKSGLNGTHQKIVYSTLNSILAVVAILGNVLIIGVTRGLKKLLLSFNTF